MIHVIGDSHVMVFSGKEHIPDNVDEGGFLPFFRTYRLGPYTAYHAVKLRSLIESIIKEKVGPDEAVMLCFGEIDCRVHLVKQSETQRRPIEDIVAECVEQYAQLFEIKEKYGIRLLVWNVPASSREEIDEGEYPTYGTCFQRNEATRLFNKILSEECKRRGVVFVSIFDKLIDEEGLTKTEYYADPIHLSQRAMPLILEVLRNQMLIDAPLRAAGHDRHSHPLNQTADSGQHAKEERVLIWCGIGEVADLIAYRPNYDRCYLIDTERRRTDYVRSLYRNDKNVTILHTPVINLLSFCKEQGIESIDTLVIRAKGNELDLVRTLERFTRKRKVRSIQCQIPTDQINVLARFLGDAYEIASVPEITGEGATGVRCILKGDNGQPSRPVRRQARPVFNVVYAHLSDEQGSHAAHRGDVSVIWSRLPLSACQLYLYLNAYSFMGKQDGLDVLFLSEPTVVLPGQYDETVWRRFDHIITPYDAVITRTDKCTKLISPRKGNDEFFLDGTVTEDRALREKAYPLDGRKPGICMINGNKGSSFPGELYSKRAETALWFASNSTIPFDVFGKPPFDLPNYRGAPVPEAKLSTLAKYRFGLAFENTNHSVFALGYVDKILSCLETRTIPIYYGASNIDDYLPRECFIDFRAFRDNRELERFLLAMSDKQYKGYVEAIDDFVARGGLRPYATNTLYNQLIQLYATHASMRIEELSDDGEAWKQGLSQVTEGRSFREKEGTHLWPWEILATSSGAKRDINKTLADVNDCYRSAQSSIMSKDYESALQALNEVVSLMPGHTYALNDIGAIHSMRRDHDLAVTYFERSFLAERSNHTALKNLLFLLESMSRKDDMARIMTQIDPETLGDTPDDKGIAEMIERNKVDIAGFKGSTPKKKAVPHPPTSGETDKRRANHVEIMGGCQISPDTQIGDYTYVGFNCFITRATIGRYCSIANCVKIGQGEHEIDRISTSTHFYERPYEQLTKGDCIIGNNVWIGVDSIIKRGVSIGDGAVIGANSFVNSDVPDYAIAVGSPAKVVKFRFPPEKVALIKNSNWWNYEIEGAGKLIKALEKGFAKGTEYGLTFDEPFHTLVTLAFSKDRALQLHAALQSFLLHWQDKENVQMTIKVLYTASNYFHERQYLQLMEELPEVQFVREKDFKTDLLAALAGHEQVLFMVDDNIFVRDFRYSDVVDALGRRPRALGFSLRLGKNTLYSYMVDKEQTAPEFDRINKDVLCYDWTTSEYDFGYPLEVSSSVYRIPDILPLLTQLPFNNPNTLEAAIDANKSLFGESRAELLCFEKSVTFCNPLNKVQAVCAGNRSGTEEQSHPDRLGNLFRKGYRIDVGKFSGFTSKGCHQEVDLPFVFKEKLGKGLSGRVSLDQPLVSIAIPNYNGLNHIKICLESIGRNTPEDHEIIVVDNGSSDGSLEYLRNVSGIILIENPVNVGAPGARNQALSIVQGNYVVFMDNDTIVTRDWLSRFIDHAERDPDVGIIGACTNYATGPQRVRDAVSYTSIDGLEAYAAKRAEEHRDELVESPRLISFCIFFKREVVERIGGMDTSFSKFCYEDDDYSIRATIAGLKSVVALDVFIHHTGGPQGRGDKEYNAWLAQAWEGFRRKWRIAETGQPGQYEPAILAARPFTRSEHYVPLPERQVVENLICLNPDRRTVRTKRLGGPGYTVEDHFGKALSYQKAGNIDLAIEELEQVLATDERHVEACNDLGVLLYRKGDKQRALSMLSKAVMLQPDHVGHLKNLAALALEVGETEDAIGLYRKILSLNPSDVDTLLVVGHLCEQYGQTENALLHFRSVLEKEPGNAQAAEALERIKMEGEDANSAAKSEQMQIAESTAARQELQ
jgi:GT2 family glycosyltransferase/acetyltransferase-like isoleucine patch superfamily enzyme/Flp pilus assembly protein TadD